MKNNKEVFWYINIVATLALLVFILFMAQQIQCLIEEPIVFGFFG